MTDLRTAAQQALEFVTSERWGTTPYMDVRVYEDAAKLRGALRAALAEPVQADPNAYGYASRLAVAIWEKHYKGVAPDWKPLDDLMGVLTQIDNMTAGLTRQEQAEPVQEPCPNCASLEAQNAELDAILARLADTERKPLTEDEIRQVGASYTDATWIDEGWSIDFARAVERAHGIGAERPATLTKPCGSLGEDVSLCSYPDCAGGQAGTICNNWCLGARK